MNKETLLQFSKRLATALFFLGLSFYASSASANFLNDTQAILNWGRLQAGLTSPAPAMVVLNITTILATVVTYTAFAALSWGAITYMISLGEEGRAARAKRIILYAIIGLFIANSTNLIAQIVICGVVGNVNDPICQNWGGAGSVVAPLISFINTVLIGPAAAIAFGALVAGGYLYMIAAGDESKISRAKNTIIYALLGLLVIGISGIIVNVILAL